jgi:hypothetical protein
MFTKIIEMHVLYFLKECPLHISLHYNIVVHENNTTRIF